MGLGANTLLGARAIGTAPSRDAEGTGCSQSQHVDAVMRGFQLERQGNL